MTGIQGCWWLEKLVLSLNFSIQLPFEHLRPWGLSTKETKESWNIQFSVLAQRDQDTRLTFSFPPGVWVETFSFADFKFSSNNAREKGSWLWLTDLGSCKQRTNSLRSGNGTGSCSPCVYPAAPANERALRATAQSFCRNSTRLS